MTDDKTEQLATMVVSAAQVFIDKKLAPVLLKLSDLVAEIENSVGAGAGAAMQSLERRASRQAEHIGRLETKVQALTDRIQALEHGAPPAPLRLGDHRHVR